MFGILLVVGYVCHYVAKNSPPPLTQLRNVLPEWRGSSENYNSPAIPVRRWTICGRGTLL